MIVGIGIDLMSVQRFSELITISGQSYIERCFSSAEQQECNGIGDRIQNFAMRFAGKEAVLKSMGHGFGNGIGFSDIQILTESECRFDVALLGSAQIIALEAGISKFHVTIVNAEQFVIAHSIAEQ